jgi:hypothetical protein
LSHFSIVLSRPDAVLSPLATIKIVKMHLKAMSAVNRRSNMTPYRRPILTPLSDGFWR